MWIPLAAGLRHSVRLVAAPGLGPFGLPLLTLGRKTLGPTALLTHTQMHRDRHVRVPNGSLQKLSLETQSSQPLALDLHVPVTFSTGSQIDAHVFAH